MTPLPPVEAYRLLAPTYDELPNPLLTLEQRTTAALLPPLAGLIAVDVAAGTGRWARYCRHRGAYAVAIDFCTEMIHRAAGTRILGDARQLPIRDGAADLVIFSFALGYAPDCLPELARITRKGGTVIVSDIHPGALRHGWRRSFRVNGRLVEAVSSDYDIPSLDTHGLHLIGLEEPHFAAMERQIFERAGKPHLFDASRPAVFVSRWERQ